MDISATENRAIENLSNKLQDLNFVSNELHKEEVTIVFGLFLFDKVILTRQS